MGKPEKPVAAYQTGAHTKHRLRYHVVWLPKYRKRILAGKIAARVEALLREACALNDWQIHELSIQADHVHLLLQIPPRLSVCKVVQRLKGGTSKLLRSEFPELVEFLWGRSFWSTGYFAETMGKLEEAVIRRYIRGQGVMGTEPVQKASSNLKSPGL